MLARKNALSIPVIAVHTSTIVPRVAGSSSGVGGEQAATAGKKKRRHTQAALPKSACSDSEEKEDDDDDSNLSGVGRRCGASTYAPRTLTRHADTRFATRHPTRDILSELLLEDVRKPRELHMVRAGICSPK